MYSTVRMGMKFFFSRFLKDKIRRKKKEKVDDGLLGVGAPKAIEMYARIVLLK